MTKYYSINEFSKILGVSAQTLRNEECGCVIDRDYNASVNLMKYGQSIA